MRCAVGSDRRRSSVYEGRRSDLWGRMRRWLHGPDRGREIAYNRLGRPTWIAVDGHLVGVKATDGTLIRFPEPPADRPDLWPEEWWGK